MNNILFKVDFHAQKSLRWWYNHRDDIDMSPPYQRKSKIWSNLDKGYLIDSIINGYDIPKIYLADFTLINTNLNYNKKPYAVIDGKQRLEAIFDFFSNNLVLNNDIIYFKDKEIDLAGLSYKDIQSKYPNIASEIEEYVLHIMSVNTNDDSKINDMFVRLNKNKSLTGAEIRNAMKGEIPEIIRIISSHSFFKNKVKFSTNRGQDKNAAAKFLLIEFRGNFVDTMKANLDSLVEEGIKAENADFNTTMKRITYVLDNMNKVFIDKDPLLSSQGPLTIYYWFVKEFGDNKHIRPFLVKFNDQIKKNREISNQNPKKGNPILLQYEFLNRSTNNASSMFGRYRILTSRFIKYVNELI